MHTLPIALHLAEQGFPVFPCLMNKAPACAGGFKAASKDLNEVKALWLRSPAALIGIPTGAVSGFDVLDIDPRHGGDEWLNANSHRLPTTRTHYTKSGGRHLLFKHQCGVRNSAGKIANGIDIRGDGGYIIWWPALDLPVVNEAPIADWPDWLIAAMTPVPQSCTPPLPTTSGGNAYARGALRDAAKTVANAPEGRRNDTLNKECWALLRFIGSGALSAQDIATTLASAALSNGLSRREVINTLSSALRSRGIA